MDNQITNNIKVLGQGVGLRVQSKDRISLLRWEELVIKKKKKLRRQ